MQTRLVSLLVLLCAAGTSQGQTLDLSKVECPIRKEPAYQSKTPKYCRIVFGPQAKNLVWVVVDGDHLFVDRNGNGDLTDDGEIVERKGGYFSQIGALRIGDAKPPYELHSVVPSGGNVQPDFYNLTINMGRWFETGSCLLADTPKEAPVLWFDGPLMIGLADPDNTVFTRGDDQSELRLWVGTPRDPKKQKEGDPVVRVSHSKGVPEGSIPRQ